MHNDQAKLFTVGIRRLSEPPVVTDGEVTRGVVFYIHADEDQTDFEMDGGVVRGDVLSRCLDLQEKGPVLVYMPPDWAPDLANDNWHQEVVEAALDRAKSESA